MGDKLARAIIILGEDEHSTGLVTVKNFARGEQVKVARGELVSILGRRAPGVEHAVIEDRSVAKEVSETLTGVFDSLGQSMLLVNDRCASAEADAYREKVGNIFYEITFKLLEPL